MVGQPRGNGDAAEQGEEPEDKPLSDEARSAFTPPLGVPLPPVPEDEQPASEFTVPEGLVAPQPYEPGSAFTPPEGIPVIGPLAKPGSPWQDRMRTMVRMPLAERPVPERAARSEDVDTGPSAPRVLDLILRIGELLLAGGEGAEDVEAAMFGVAHAYGLDRTEPTVTFTLLSITHQPSLVDDPVTLSRTVRRRGTDYTRLASVFGLVADITQGDVTLEEAYRRLAEMRRNRHPFSKGALTVRQRALSGAASLLVGGTRWCSYWPRSARCSATGWPGCARGAGCPSSTSSPPPRCRPPPWGSPSRCSTRSTTRASRRPPSSPAASSR